MYWSHYIKNSSHYGMKGSKVGVGGRQSKKEVTKMGAGEQEVQSSSYGMSKLQGWNVQHREYSRWYRNGFIWWQTAVTLVSIA